jgi:hypothetical protein
VTRITWDDGNKLYSRGISQGVLYPQNSPGVAWNGLISVLEKGDNQPVTQYLDGIPYNNHTPPTIFDGTLNAYTYPDEFEVYNGVVSGITAQRRASFGLSYRDNNELHILYNATVAPSNDQYQSLSDTPNPVSFSWTISTLPVDVAEIVSDQFDQFPLPIPQAGPTSHLIVSLVEINSAALSLLEAALYGDDANEPYLPMPSDIIEMIESNTTIRITRNQVEGVFGRTMIDGIPTYDYGPFDRTYPTWTAVGPDDLVIDNGDGSFTINSPTAYYLDEDTYVISSSN